MSDHGYADRAARVLRARARSLDSRVTRDVGIGLVAHGMSLARRRRSVRRTLWSGLGAAAMVLAVFLGWSRSHGGATTLAPACAGPGCVGARSDATTARQSPYSASFGAGHTLTAPADAPARATLASGSRFELAAGGALACTEDGRTQRLQLSKGSVHLEVNKLREGERFLVSTADAEVEVRGTAFDVTVVAATDVCAPRTSVAVDHGVVEVRSAGGSDVLHAGGRWSSPCTPPPVDQPRARTATHLERLPSEPAAVARRDENGPSSASLALVERSAPDTSTERSAPDTSAERSALREQNDLYAQAEIARRGGRSGEALALYSRLLSGFAQGPLTESATVGRVRTLSRVDTVRAKREAERYLARFPSGFARAEMSALVSTP
jgi:hypothetical protein